MLYNIHPYIFALIVIVVYIFGVGFVSAWTNLMKDINENEKALFAFFWPVTLPLLLGAVVFKFIFK
jgi:hypothetical protein